MDDINSALQHIKEKNNGEIPYQYGSKECAKLMTSFAKEYHQEKSKALIKWYRKQTLAKACNDDAVIEMYLKSNSR